jgi:hypothetical protein
MSGRSPTRSPLRMSGGSPTRSPLRMSGGERLPDDAELHCFIHEQMLKGRHKQEIKLRLKIINEFIAASPDIRLHTDVTDEQFLILLERSISTNNLCKGELFEFSDEITSYPEPLSFALISPTDGTILGIAFIDQSSGSIFISILCGSKFKGVGTKLLDTVKRYATFTGFTMSLASLPSAESFYEHYGMEPQRLVKGLYKWRPPPELARARRDSNSILVEDGEKA